MCQDDSHCLGGDSVQGTIEIESQSQIEGKCSIQGNVLG